MGLLPIQLSLSGTDIDEHLVVTVSGISELAGAALVPFRDTPRWQCSAILDPEDHADLGPNLMGAGVKVEHRFRWRSGLTSAP